MKFAAMIFLALSTSSFANTYFLSKFVGSHSVVSKQCKPSDKLCKSVVRVELASVGNVAFLLYEFDASNRIVSSKDLTQDFGDLITTTLGGFSRPTNGGFTGMWTLLKKNSEGKQVQREALYFNSDFLFEEQTIKLSITLWKKAEQPESPDINERRDFVLSRNH